VRMKVLAATLALVFATTMFASPLQQGENAPANSDQARISQEVRHQLLLLPYYTVFDVLEYSVNGGTVTLRGYVTRPTLKRDAEGAVKDVSGVTKVINQIQELPPSSMDDQIRRAEYRSIYGFDPLSRYAWGAVPQIHIIVNSGRVTLYGKVDNAADKQMIVMRAKLVPGTFSVEDHLEVANPTEK